MTNTNRVIRDQEDMEELSPLARTLHPPRPIEAPPVPKSPHARARRSAGGNGAYPGLKQVTSYVERGLYLQLRAISAESDLSMITLMEQALTEFVQRYAAKRKFASN